MKLINFLLFFGIVMIFISSCTDPLGDDPSDINLARELISIDQVTTLVNHRDGVDYIAKSRVDLRAKLVIEPGVEIQFEEGAYLDVHSNGAISAEGTASEMIIMTNTGSNFASWPGIVVGSTSASNTLNYCLIEYAGDGEAFGTFNTEQAAVTLVGGRIRMDNCTIKNSGGSGIVTVSSINECTISSFTNNSFIESTNFPIYVSQNYLEDMNLASCTYTDNTRNMIGINSGHQNRLYTKSVWSDLAIPYYVEDGFELYEGLTIEAGTEVIFGNNSFLTVSGSSSFAPFLSIQGTQSNHVVLRGEEALIGYWQGVRIDQANAKNILEYTDISDGGSDSDFKANITLYNRGTNLTINNCTSARSGDCDVLLDDFLGAPILTNNSPGITDICNQ